MDQHIESMIEALERAKAELKRIKSMDCSNKEKALECASVPANLLQQLRIDLIVRRS